MVFAGNVERESIQRMLEDTERYYEQVRKARHEMANHLTTIRGLAEQGLILDMKQYISEIDDTIQSVEMRYFTGNPVTDVVINDKYRKAKEKGVLFSSVFSFDESWGIAVYDLSIVLSNILDNALKAETIYDFIADKIICELVRLKGYSSIQRFAWELVERNVNPGKYSQYGENPEKAIELMKKD